MSSLKLDNTAGAPGTPANDTAVAFLDAATQKPWTLDSGGIYRSGMGSTNHAATQQTGFASDTYLTGSNLVIPTFGMQVGQLYRWEVGIEKTAAGTAAIALSVRIGAAGAIGDTARAVPTQTVAQAATASANTMFVSVFVRTVSASGVIVASMGFTGTQLGDGDRLVSSTFDNTALGGQFIGLSLNGGASAAYTIDYVKGWLVA